MTLSVNGRMVVSAVDVVTTQNTGLSVEHWADRLLNKIVYVAENSDTVIKDQAMAFKEDIREACIHHMKQAIRSDRTTLYNLFLKQGEPEMAEIIRRLK